MSRAYSGVGHCRQSTRYMRELLRTVFLGSRTMAVLTTYMDESGTHDGALVCVVGGFVASPSQWRKFTGKWCKALKDEELPYLHVADYLASRDDFEFTKDWPHHRKTMSLYRLAGVVRNHARALVATSVLLSEFENAVSKTDGGRKYFPTPYSYCHFWSVLSISLWAQEQESRGPVSVLFERGPKKGGEIAGKFYAAIQKPMNQKKWKLGIVGTETSDNVVAFQACDLVSHKLYSRLGIMSQGKPLPNDKAVEPLGQMKMIGAAHSEANIAKAIALYKKHIESE